MSDFVKFMKEDGNRGNFIIRSSLLSEIIILSETYLM